METRVSIAVSEIQRRMGKSTFTRHWDQSVLTEYAHQQTKLINLNNKKGSDKSDPSLSLNRYFL